MKKILIVEDEKILGEMYRDRFSQAGFDVALAVSAEEGMEAVPKVKPDLILLDILLPRANGVGFMEWLKKQKEFSSIPVVAFSNYDEPTTKKEAFLLGVKDYLIKTNYTPSEIVARIKQLLSEG